MDGNELKQYLLTTTVFPGEDIWALVAQLPLSERLELVEALGQRLSSQLTIFLDDVAEAALPDDISSAQETDKLFARLKAAK